MGKKRLFDNREEIIKQSKLKKKEYDVAYARNRYNNDEQFRELRKGLSLERYYRNKESNIDHRKKETKQVPFEKFEPNDKIVII